MKKLTAGGQVLIVSNRSQRIPTYKQGTVVDPWPSHGIAVEWSQAWIMASGTVWVTFVCGLKNPLADGEYSAVYPLRSFSNLTDAYAFETEIASAWDGDPTGYATGEGWNWIYRAQVIGKYTYDDWIIYRNTH